MAVYGYSEERVESIIRVTKRLRLRYCAAAAAILAAAGVVAAKRPEWIFGAQQQARMWVVMALVIFIAGPLADNLWRWKSRPNNLAESLRQTHVTVSAEGIWLSRAISSQYIARTEIQRAEEVCWGVYLRSGSRYRWILVPSQIEEFELFKCELERLGIPIVPATVPPNWEEPMGALAFVATMLCAIFARSATLLTTDFLVSVVVAIGGFIVISANPENLPKMRWVRLGIFLPVVMTGSMLWKVLQAG